MYVAVREVPVEKERGKIASIAATYVKRGRGHGGAEGSCVDTRGDECLGEAGRGEGKSGLLDVLHRFVRSNVRSSYAKEPPRGCDESESLSFVRYSAISANRLIFSPPRRGNDDEQQRQLPRY